MDVESKRYRIVSTGWGGYEATDKTSRPSVWRALDPEDVRLSCVLNPETHERTFDAAMKRLLEGAGK